MTWEDTLNKNLKDRLGARLSTYDNSPKTKEVRKKLKQLRKEVIDAIDRAGNNTMMEEFEQELPKIREVINSLNSANRRQQFALEGALRQKRQMERRERERQEAQRGRRFVV